MTELLRQHYNPDGRALSHMFMPEIGAPDGRRRADLIVAPISIAGAKANTLIGHEIKVTRSDVMAELADQTKADSWMRYCSRWYLVVSDPALIEGLTIPDLWGVMAPPSGRRTRSMTILREAPKLTPDGDLSPVVSRIAAYTVNRFEKTMREAEMRTKYAEDRASRAEQREQELRISGGGGWVSPQVTRVNEIVRLIDAGRRNYRNGLPWLGNEDLTDADIADGILDLARTRSIAADIRRNIDLTIGNVERITEPFKHSLSQLAAIKAEASKNLKRQAPPRPSNTNSNKEAVPTGAASVIQGEK